MIVFFHEFEGDPIHGDYFRVEWFADSAFRISYVSSPEGDFLSCALLSASFPGSF